MKKFYAFFAAALMSATLFAEPTVIPTAADLALEYDVTQNIVLCCYFDVAPCNPVVLVGSYNGWSDDPAQCEVFEKLDGFEGWWVAQCKYAEGVVAKPLQLNNNSFDGWDFQVGDPDALIWLGGEQAEITAGGFAGESTIKYGGPGAYIYEVAYWKYHHNPCGVVKMHNYKLILLPPTVEDKDFFIPAVVGTFNQWSYEALDKEVYQGKIAYTKTVEAAEGTEFKFSELDFGWKNQLQWKDSTGSWQDFDNSRFPESDVAEGTIVELVLDYADTAKYRYALANAVFNEVTVKLTPPVGAPEAGIELIGEFVGGENYGKGVLMDVEGDVYTATVKSVEAGEFKFREMGNWDNQIQDKDAEGNWKDMGNLQFGEYWMEEEGVYVADVDLSDPEEYKWADHFVNITLNCNETEGSVTGDGQYALGASVTISAIPNTGYHFVQWSDGATENPRTIVLTQDTTFTAIFEEGISTDFIINFKTQDGDVLLTNSVALNMPVAPEIEGFTFVGWQPVATIIESNTIDIEAVYTANEPSSAPEVYTNPSNPAQKLIREGQIFILRGDKTYTLQGKEVR